MASVPIRPELAGVAGVPETLLSDGLLTRLSANLAPAPWSCRGSALVWWTRATRAATGALPPPIRGAARVMGVIGGFVRYQDTPVGSYDEVFAAVAHLEGVRPRTTVAFMAVDSETSLVAGRINWAMPKTLARFEGDPLGRMAAAAAGQTAWSVGATPRSWGPAVVPLRLSGLAVQQFPDGSLGRSVIRLRARGRPASVEVVVSSDGRLATWLRAGRHPGLVVPALSLSLGSARR